MNPKNLRTAHHLHSRVTTRNHHAKIIRPIPTSRHSSHGLEQLESLRRKN